LHPEKVETKEGEPEVQVLPFDPDQSQRLVMRDLML
jgi:hypothetical protein